MESETREEMDMGYATGSRVISMPGNGRMIALRAPAPIYSTTAISTGGKLRGVSSTGMANTHTIMGTIMKGNGKTIRKMGLGCTLTKRRTRNMKANGPMVRKKARACIAGKTEINMRVDSLRT